MSETDEQEQPAWKRPTAAQEVSNRSILRIQQLSDELREQLKQMRLFRDHMGDIKEVYLAARDHRFEQFQESQEFRWYNFRLTASLDFDDADRRWIALERNTKRFKPLFDLAKHLDQHTAASYEAFASGVRAWGEDGTKSDPDRQAFDQFMIALAVLPYGGLLPGCLEQCFRLDDETEEAPSCFLFFSPRDQHFNFAPFGEFRFSDNWQEHQMPEMRSSIPENLFRDVANIDPDQQENMEKRGVNVADHAGSILSGRGKSAILELTRGKSAPFSRNYNAEYPPSTKGSGHANPLEDLRGLVVPAYDLWSQGHSLGFTGGMTGWIVIILERQGLELEAAAKRIAKSEKDPNLAAHSWSHFTDLLRTYVRRVREANVRDLLEDYSLLSGSREAPVDYFRNHIHRVIGWKAEKVPGEEVTPNDREVLEIPFRNTSDPVRVPVLKLRDTRWKRPGISGQGKSFPIGTRRLCRMFLDELHLIQDAREQGGLLQAHRQFGNVGHETGRIINAISRVPTWLLPTVKSSLLLYALPAFVSLNDTHKNGVIPPILFGRDPQVEFETWLNGLIRLAARIEAFVQPAASGRYPETAQARDFVKATRSITARCRVEQPLGPLVFLDWKYRVYWGVIVLCALRNSIKHCFKSSHDQAALSYVCDDGDSPILLSLPQGKEPHLILKNPRVSGVKKNSDKKQTDGSAGAMNYYLEKLYCAVGVPEIERKWCTMPEKPDPDGFHRTRIPIPSKALKTP